MTTTTKKKHTNWGTIHEVRAIFGDLFKDSTQAYKLASAGRLARRKQGDSVYFDLDDARRIVAEQRAKAATQSPAPAPAPASPPPASPPPDTDTFAMTLSVTTADDRLGWILDGLLGAMIGKGDAIALIKKQFKPAGRMETTAPSPWRMETTTPSPTPADLETPPPIAPGEAHESSTSSENH